MTSTTIEFVLVFVATVGYFGSVFYAATQTARSERSSDTATIEIDTVEIHSDESAEGEQ